MQYRQIIKEDKTLMYVLQYKKIKNIIGNVDKENRVIIKAPIGYPIELIDAFVLKYFDKFYEFIIRRENECLFNLKSNKISIKGIPHELKIQIIDKGKEKYEIIGKKIYLFIKNEDNKKKIIHKMLNDLGREYLINLTYKFAKKFNQQLNEVETKWYHTKWGQCEPHKKKISLAIQLYMFNDALIDYVIVHELCHLIHPNHSKDFWDLVGKIYPDYKIAKEKLKFEC